MRSIQLLLAVVFAAGAAWPVTPARPMAGNAPRFRALVEDARQRVPLLPVSRLERLMNGPLRRPLLIDVREDAEWQAGHIPGAIHLSKGVLEREIEGVAAGPWAEIVLYCGSGSRSVLAADSLMRMGYKRVYSLDGGYTAWERRLPPL